MGDRLLDIGAGNGSITSAALAPHSRSLVVTETSVGMARRLRRAGHEVWCEDIAELGLERVASGSGGFTLVAALNVLDRCVRPRSLLQACWELLDSPPKSAWLLLAIPLPYSPAHWGPKTRWSGNQLEDLDLGKATTWEDHAAQLVRHTLPAAGFEAAALARLPYLCA